jgi:hypothetical protein
MGTYEVSRDMITKANAAVGAGGGGLGITLGDLSGNGGNGVNRPAPHLAAPCGRAVLQWFRYSPSHLSTCLLLAA